MCGRDHAARREARGDMKLGCTSEDFNLSRKNTHHGLYPFSGQCSNNLPTLWWALLLKVPPLNTTMLVTPFQPKILGWTHWKQIQIIVGHLKHKCILQSILDCLCASEVRNPITFHHPVSFLSVFGWGTLPLCACHVYVFEYVFMLLGIHKHLCEWVGLFFTLLLTKGSGQLLLQRSLDFFFLFCQSVSMC